MAKGKKTGGRQKGTPNKVTGDVRAMIRRALEGVGGVEYLMSCARANPQSFLALVGKALPKELEVQSDNNITLRWLREGEEPRA